LRRKSFTAPISPISPISPIIGNKKRRNRRRLPFFLVVIIRERDNKIGEIGEIGVVCRKTATSEENAPPGRRALLP
jgi:hypothetical protein